MRLSRRVALTVATIVPVLALGASSVGTEGTEGTAATCEARVPSDVNGDGFADLVVGEPGRKDGSSFDEDSAKGAVRILYGTASGVGTAGDQFFDADSVGVRGGLGHSVTTGHFNDDCFADVAVGSWPPFSGPPDYVCECAVVVLYGSAAGLSADRSLIIQGNTLPGVQAEHFGFATTAGDFDGDGRGDLAIGAPQTDAGGGVAIVYGAAAGLDLARTQWITQDSPGVPGRGEGFDHFGASLAAGDFTGDGRADLAIGVPYERIGSTLHAAGRIVVLPGSATGLDPAGRSFDQDSPGMPGRVEQVDTFGSPLAAGDIDGDHKAELAIGTTSGNLGSGPDSIQAAGMVTVIRFGADLTAAGFQSFTQNTSGIPGAAEDDDSFGSALAFGDFNGDGRADLAIGAAAEKVGDLSNAGAVTVLYADGTTLTTNGAAVFARSTIDAVGSAESQDHFGHSLSTMPRAGTPGSDLVIGVELGDVGTVSDAGLVIILSGGASGLTGTGSTTLSAAPLTNGAVDNGHFGVATH